MINQLSRLTAKPGLPLPPFPHLPTCVVRERCCRTGGGRLTLGAGLVAYESWDHRFLPMPYLRAKTQRLLPFLAKTIVAAVHMFHICSSYRALNKSDVLHDSSRSPTRMMWRAGFGRGRCDRAALLSRLSPLFLAERSRYCKSNKSTLGMLVQCHQLCAIFQEVDPTMIRQNEGLLLAGLHGGQGARLC